MNYNKPDYDELAASHAGLSYGAMCRKLAYALEPLWADIYEEMTPAEKCIDVIPQGAFDFMFDSPSTIVPKRPFVWGQDVEDRTVVAFGRSEPIRVKRDRNRMRGPLGAREWGEAQDGFTYDRGHFIAHCIGGPEDMGLFPQRRDINRGRSIRGRVFRLMERYCQENPGVFCFSRPIYLDKSAHPHYLEFGILRPDGTFWVELFENRYTDKLFTSPADAGYQPP